MFDQQQHDDLLSEQRRLEAEGCSVYMRLGPFGFELDVVRPEQKEQKP